LKLKLLILITLTSFLTACAATMPSHIADPASHPTYATSKYITAVGMSDRSFDDAEKLAQAKVSEQVRSQIEYQYEMAMSNQGIDHKGLVKKQTSFSHAEMIRVDTSSQAKVGKAYYAFAYLSRHDVFKVLESEYESEATRFRRSAQSLPQLHHDLPAYTAGLRQAQSSFAALSGKAFEIRAVTMKDVPAHRQDEATFLAMERDRVTLLRDLKITVRIENGSIGEAREVILMALTGALTRLGLEATPGACGPQKHELRVKAEVNCRRGSFGPQCSLDMAGVLVHCASGAVLAEADLNDSSFKGIHTKDRSRALTQLYSSITPDALVPQLQKSLSGVLPIDASQPNEGAM
jgi:hypothetical protein